MIDNLSQAEIEEYSELLNFRSTSPERMTDGDWDRYNELRTKRFEGL